MIGGPECINTKWTMCLLSVWWYQTTLLYLMPLDMTNKLRGSRQALVKMLPIITLWILNTIRPDEIDRHFGDGIYYAHVLVIWAYVSLNFVPSGLLNKAPVVCNYNPCPNLTHWDRDKMAAFFQTTFSNGFSWMKIYGFRLGFHWSLFIGFELTTFQHWFR